jgi:uncharacterized protein (TIGR03435 family)
MLKPMRMASSVALLALLLAGAFAPAQPKQPSFDVVSVRPSQREVGPDSNNQIRYSPTGFTGQHVTLKRLVAEAWRCQRNQVIGPAWIDRNEYDIAARLPEGATQEQIPLMLRSLLAERFGLKEHSETRSMRGYELTVAAGGPRIRPVLPGEATSAGQGLHFRGNMRQFADLLAVQISIPAPTSASVPVIADASPAPVLDKTGLDGVYEFSVDLRPEIGADGFTFWKRVLEDQLGLRIQSRKVDVEFVVVDDALKIPTAN